MTQSQAFCRRLQIGGAADHEHVLMVVSAKDRSMSMHSSRWISFRHKWHSVWLPKLFLWSLSVAATLANCSFTMITMSAPVSITPSAGTPCTIKQARWGLLPLSVSWICLHPLNLKVRVDHKGLAIQGIGLTRYRKCLAHMLYVVVQRQGEKVYQYTDFQLILWRDSSGWMQLDWRKVTYWSTLASVVNTSWMETTGQFASPKKLRIEVNEQQNGHDHLYLL